MTNSILDFSFFFFFGHPIWVNRIFFKLFPTFVFQNHGFYPFKKKKINHCFDALINARQNTILAITNKNDLQNSNESYQIIDVL